MSTKIIGIILLLIATSVMSEDKICLTEDQYVEIVQDIEGDMIEKFEEKLGQYKEELVEELIGGKLVYTEEEYDAMLRDYLQFQIQQWRTEGIIVVSIQDLEKFVDDQVARALSGGDNYSISDEEIRAGIRLMERVERIQRERELEERAANAPSEEEIRQSMEIIYRDY